MEVNFLRQMVTAQRHDTTEHKLLSTQALQAPAELDHDGVRKTSTERPRDPNMAQVKAAATAKYTVDLRKELLGEEHSSTGVRLRGVGAAPVQDADVDSIMKHHHDIQAKLADEFLMMTRSLKDNVSIAGRIVRDDNKMLDRMNVQTDKNVDQLKKESVRLEKYAYGSCDCWIWILLGVVCITFIFMVLFMRLFPKR